MKILCLYNNSCALPLFDWLKEQGHDVLLCTEKIDAEWCDGQTFDLTVSYTYKYILQSDTLAKLQYNVVNLHNSYLPWNRGADPNMWSIVEGTPRGVTLHYINEKLDQGEIITQQLVPLSDIDTLKSSYDRLDYAAQNMFKQAFVFYPYWAQMKKKPEGIGTYHLLKDATTMKEQISSYEMNVVDFQRAVNKELKNDWRQNTR